MSYVQRDVADNPAALKAAFEREAERLFAVLQLCLGNELMLTRAHWSDLVFQCFAELGEHLGICESPIEKCLCVSLHYCLHDLVGLVQIVPQMGIDVGSRRYRVDFCIKEASEASRLIQPFRIVVECDGHDFHEKTKDQAAADKQRDRHLAALGCTVLRFTGSEIWADSHKCASEVRAIVKQLLQPSRSESS